MLLPSSTSGSGEGAGDRGDDPGRWFMLVVPSTDGLPVQTTTTDPAFRWTLIRFDAFHFHTPAAADFWLLEHTHLLPHTLHTNNAHSQCGHTTRPTGAGRSNRPRQLGATFSCWGDVLRAPFFLFFWMFCTFFFLVVPTSCGDTVCYFFFFSR